VKIALGADHAGWRYKDAIADQLRRIGHDVLDFGTHSDVAVDYPEYGYAVGLAVATGRAERGIVVCGSSIGISVAANKVPGIRCALVSEPYGCELSRRHNDANVIALSERLMGWEMVERLVEIFLTTPFEGGRHSHRVAELEFTPAEKAKAEKALSSGAVTGAETPAELLGR